MDTNKLISMIALVICGLLIAAWGAIYIWLNNKDKAVLEELKIKGQLTEGDYARLTNPTWIWVLAVVQIIIGVGLILWGIFQYFASVDTVVEQVRAKAPTFRSMFNGSRPSFNIPQRDLVDSM